MKFILVIFSSFFTSVTLYAQTECMEYDLEYKEISTPHIGNCGHTDNKPLSFTWKSSYTTIEECMKHLNLAADKVSNNNCGHTEIDVVKSCKCSLYRNQVDTVKSNRRLDGMCANQKQNAYLLNSKFENW